MGEVPEASVPMKFPWRTFPVESITVWYTPAFVLPEMTLAAPAAGPPTVLFLAVELTETPQPFGTAALPAARTPVVVWQEMTFRSGTVVPPTVLFAAPVVMYTP